MTLPLAERVANDVVVLRRSFNAGKTRPFSARRASLQALMRMMTENESLICSALWEDLHRNATETIASEFSLVTNEIQEQLDYFEDWAAPQKVSTDLLNTPGSSAILADPLGVCCVIGPWNYPFNLIICPLAGCLSAGNTCLVRVPDAEYCSKSAGLMFRLLREYMDEEIVRVVEGSIEATKVILDQTFDKIFFTGGTYGGKIVARAAAEKLTPVVLELGGKSPAIVDSSADIPVASKRIAWGAYTNAGQTCITPDYILVHISIADRFIEGMKEAIDDMYGKRHEEIQKTPNFGRIANTKRYQCLMEMLQDSKDYIVKGGHFDEAECFIEPTIMDFGTDTDAFAASKLMGEEIFGPITPLLRYESLDQALEFIRARPKPLTLHCFSSNKSMIERVLCETSSGGAIVNDCLVQKCNSALPFGGVGNSGLGGAYNGKASFDVFSHKKSVLYKPFYLDIPQRYPPYSPFDDKLFRFLLAPRPRKQMYFLKLGIGSISLAILLKFVGDIGMYYSVGAS